MSFDRASFAATLTAWFENSQRDLPWREPHNARDPYRVLVSEIMLQQTTVAAVIPYYLRFLERFPSVESLAAVDVDEVLPLWAGLGYYSRARNLHACAKAVMEKHGGRFPTDYEQILALPGIGRYTAGAVLSIAENLPVPLVDANVARLLARLFCIQSDLKSTTAHKQLWEEAELLVKAAPTPREFNPAMMELGALVCTARKARCEVCPVSKFCCAFHNNCQDELPVISPKRAEVELHDVCVFITLEDRVLLRRRPEDTDEKNWWHGMWELPRTTRIEDESDSAAIGRLLKDFSGVQARNKLKRFKHGVTHHKITLDCYRVEAEISVLPEGWDFFEWDEIQGLALPSVMKRLLNWLQEEERNSQLKLL